MHDVDGKNMVWIALTQRSLASMTCKRVRASNSSSLKRAINDLLYISASGYEQVQYLRYV